MRGFVALLGLLVASCGDTTGGALVRFNAAAKGVASNGPLSFTTATGAQVSLDEAHLLVGAVYLNQSVPTSGAAAQSCISQGLYAGEVFGPLEVDLLSGQAQPFADAGEGTNTEARTAEVWFTSGDIDAPSDDTPVLTFKGSAGLDGGVVPIEGSVTIGANRLPAVTDPTLPSADPICRQRIVSPLLVELTLAANGQLTLQIDPRRLFDAVDFSTVSRDGGTFSFPDDETGQGAALFRGLHSSAVYQLDWNNPQ